MPSVTSGDQVIHEDLSDAFLNIDVRKTPLLARFKRGEQLSNTLFSWTVQTYDGRRTEGIPENKDVDSFETNKQYRLWNRSQKFWRTPMVTTEANDINRSAADFGKMKQEITNKTREQQRDVETRICDDRSSKDDDGLTGREFLGLGMTINDGLSVGMSGAALTNSDPQTTIPKMFLTPTAQIYTGPLTDTSASATPPVTAVFNQNSFLDMLQNRFDNVGMTTELALFCDALLKRHIAQYFMRYAPNVRAYDTIVRTPQEAIEAKRMALFGADLIQTDFGNISIDLVSWMPRRADGTLSGRGYLLDMEHMRIRPSGLWMTYRSLEDKGAGPRGLVQSIFGWEFGDPRGCCKIDPNVIQTTSP